MSLPVRERGLKFYTLISILLVDLVAPRAGAWIEIVVMFFWLLAKGVAPRAGAWIEIRMASP